MPGRRLGQGQQVAADALPLISRCDQQPLDRRRFPRWLRFKAKVDGTCQLCALGIGRFRQPHPAWIKMSLRCELAKEI